LEIISLVGAQPLRLLLTVSVILTNTALYFWNL